MSDKLYQSEKLAFRLNQLLACDGLHEVKIVVVNGDILFWTVQTLTLEGVPKKDKTMVE